MQLPLPSFLPPDDNEAAAISDRAVLRFERELTKLGKPVFVAAKLQCLEHCPANAAVEHALPKYRECSMPNHRRHASGESLPL